MTYHSDPEAYAKWMEAVADDARIMAQSAENTNNRHPMASFLLGVEFAARYAAYEARVIDD